jgi:FkbM family methyltransferase
VSLVSYAQNLEDVLLWRGLGSAGGGFYIDVGAAHPIQDSVTQLFYERGWNGINIEPHPRFFPLLVAQRPRDLNLQIGISDRPGRLIFYEDTELAGNSSFDARIAERRRAEGVEIIEHELEVRTLAQVCQEYVDGEIDFLKIDVEGFERQVLAGADFNRFRPRVLVIEANEIESWEGSLRAAGYVKTLFEGVNAVFVRDDEEGLVGKLGEPVTSRDDFVKVHRVRAAHVMERKPLGGHMGFKVNVDQRKVGRIDQSPLIEPMRTLIALSSSNQLYSGLGRHLFELVARLSERCDFVFAIDDAIEHNVEILRAFCSEHSLPLCVGRHADRGTLDFVNADLVEVINGADWDTIECFSWANAGTNRIVLDCLTDQVLVYTPHYQPVESVPMSPGHQRQINDVQGRMFRRADVIFCDSPHERRLISAADHAAGRCVHVPIGCDFTSFRPVPGSRQRQLLFVGDQAEPRKRFDRAVAVFGGVHSQHPDLRFVVVGNRAADAAEFVPPTLRPNLELRGYVSEEELRRAYSESIGLILLSDHEAFAIPVLEALASGTPVFIADIAVLRSLFGSLPGVHFCPPDDEEAAVIIERVVRDEEEAISDVLAVRPQLAARFDWQRLAEFRWNAVAAAWYYKKLGLVAR